MNKNSASKDRVLTDLPSARAATPRLIEPYGKRPDKLSAPPNILDELQAKVALPLLFSLQGE
jgi:hypothetical protein